MTTFCIEPLSDYPLFSKGLADALSRQGVPSSFRRVGSRLFSRCLSRIPATTLQTSVGSFVNGRILSRTFLANLHADDVVVVYATMGLLADHGRGSFLCRVKERGAKLAVLVQDAWPVASSRHSEICDFCESVSDLVGAVTPALREMLQRRYPDREIALMEEAFDTDLFRPDFRENEPVVVWSGPPRRINDVTSMIPVLEAVSRKVPFRLRIVTGSSNPNVKTSVPVEWMPFSADCRRTFGNATVGFAQYADTDYGRCKGNYKIKTYLAAGCAVISNPVGYNHELIRPGKNGLFANKPEEWEEAFLRLLRDPGERLAMRKASRELAVDRFSYSAIAKQYAGVLRRLGVESRAVTK